MVLKCDNCKTNFHYERIILKKECFAYPESKLARNVSRVCLKCARNLMKKGLYIFNEYWVNLLENIHLYG